MRITKILAVCLAILLLTACGAVPEEVPEGGVAATTAPVAQFARAIAEGTDVPVTQVITDSVSCLHDYSLSVRQMKIMEQSDLVLLSGAGLEDFLEDALDTAQNVVDCSAGVNLIYAADGTPDPHIWLNPSNAVAMVKNICSALSGAYPLHEDMFQMNAEYLMQRLLELDAHGRQTVMAVSKPLITFHDGFAYLADAYGIQVLAAVEEESGSQASAIDLEEVIALVRDGNIPAVFTETNGSSSAASVIAKETDAAVYELDMALGEGDYFEIMTQNFNTIYEALQ